MSTRLLISVMGFTLWFTGWPMPFGALADRPAFAREPQYPLKTSRSLRSDAQIHQARQAVSQDESARAILAEILSAAAPWLDRSDEEILALIPDASVPRSYSVGNAGCPKCGTRVYEKGTYPWILDPDGDIYRVTCPVDGSSYPGNDYRASMAVSFRDRNDPDQSYYDDGWGWTDEKGNRYWFVAYACHGQWSKLLGDLLSVSRAYVLTGDTRYAHVAALILAEIADRYPSMHYPTQSRRGVEFNDPYAYGRILNYVGETRTLSTLAEAYDNVWDWIDRDQQLQDLRGQTGRDIRALIEADLLEEGMDAVWDKDIMGNFGMHQKAYAMAALVRQNGPLDVWLEQLIDPDDVPHMLHEGLKYALFNFVLRDGMPMEVAPAYNRIWPNNIYPVTELLQAAGKELPAAFQPRLRDLALAPLQTIVADRFTPDQGDSGSPYGGVSVPSPHVYLAASRRFDHPLFHKWLSEQNLFGRYHDYEMLFRPLPSAKEGHKDSPVLPRSRLLDGYGTGILESRDRSWGLSMYYGHIDGHAQRDNLNFDLYANGQKMMPDLGYPDQSDGYTPGRYTWTANTIAHNCVMIDRKQPRGLGPAQLKRFVSVDGFSMIDADAGDTVYAQAETYRRALIMVEPGEGQGYVVDIFRVVGGDEHHYSLHGPPGEVQEIEGRWSEPLGETLAGPGVALGEMYDRPVMCQPDYRGTFYDYYGSGFSHFVNVRSLTEGFSVLQFQHVRDSQARLNIRILHIPEVDNVMSADAQASPRVYKEMLRYLLVHRMRKTDDPLASTFVSVIEPFGDQPMVSDTMRHDIEGGVAVEIRRGTDRDVLLYQLSEGAVLKQGDIETDSGVSLVTFNAQEEVQRAVFSGGTHLKVKGRHWEHGVHGLAGRAGLTGRVLSVDPLQRQAVIASHASVDPARLVGRYAAFRHDGRTRFHPVLSAQTTSDGIALTFGDGLLIGRGRLARVERNQIITETKVGMVTGRFPGCVLTTQRFEQFLPVVSVSRSIGLTGEYIKETRVTLNGSVPEDMFELGDDFWLCSFGPGASVHLEPTSTWSREDESSP